MKAFDRRHRGAPSDGSGHRARGPRPAAAAHRSWRGACFTLLARAGFLSDAGIAARATARLVGKLCEFDWVDGVILFGYPGSRRGKAACLTVLAARATDPARCADACSLLDRVNVKFGTRLTMRIVPHRPPGFPRETDGGPGGGGTGPRNQND